MPEHLISTPALLDACRRCGRPILAANDEGLPVRADLQPLDPHAELAVLLEGRPTYDIQSWGIPCRPYLVWRDQFRILAARKWPVVAAHRCPPGPHPARPRHEPTELIVPLGNPLPGEPPF